MREQPPHLLQLAFDTVSAEARADRTVPVLVFADREVARDVDVSSSNNGDILRTHQYKPSRLVESSQELAPLPLRPEDFPRRHIRRAGVDEEQIRVK